MRIEHLSDHLDVVSELVSWYVAEWEPYYGDTGPGDARADLVARTSRAALPVGFVAIEDGRVVGTVALGLDVTTNLTPSVIGLLVARNHRGRGIGTGLIETCIDVAREFGHQRLYVSTSVLCSLLDRTGWKEMGETKFLNDEHGSVYVRDI